MGGSKRIPSSNWSRRIVPVFYIFWPLRDVIFLSYSRRLIPVFCLFRPLRDVIFLWFCYVLFCFFSTLGYVLFLYLMEPSWCNFCWAMLLYVFLASLTLASLILTFYWILLRPFNRWMWFLTVFYKGYFLLCPFDRWMCFLNANDLLFFSYPSNTF